MAKRPILVVDDEPEMLKSLRDLLRMDFDVFTANSGAEGMKLLQEHPIHVVMTDQRMPQMSGVEFLRQIKDEHPVAIRMIFTGYADIQAIIDAINQGKIFRYVSKPWEPDELIAALRAAGDEYDRIVTSGELLSDLKDYHSRGLRFDKSLRDGNFGQINEEGSHELDYLSTEGTKMLTRIESALKLSTYRPPV